MAAADPSQRAGDAPERILFSDFDGTVTRRDFYSCAVERLLGPGDIEPWDRFVRGEITHFEALGLILSRIRATEAELLETIRAMGIDPAFRPAVEALRAGGWQVILVSNGCSWYIERLLAEAGVSAPLLSNPGRFSPETGLTLELPRASPYFSEAVGISKAAVVRAAIDRGAVAAFAGDGRPDGEAALLAAPELRFARGWLAEDFTARGIPFRRFEAWSELAVLLAGFDAAEAHRRWRGKPAP